LGVECPGCGLTRSFSAAAHGDVIQAFHFNGMGPALFLLCLLQPPYRIAEALGVGDSSPAWAAVKSKFDVMIWLVLAGLLSQWAVKLMLKAAGALR
jgi:hypothetical protein